jgi:hypothetical protein
MLSQRVLALGCGQEIARDELGALMDQLVERVLSVRRRLAPDRSGPSGSLPAVPHE